MKKVTTVILTEQDVMDKKEIESGLDGAKLTVHAIYRRGLDCYLDGMRIKNNAQSS
jgi:hypothetical protein